MKYHVDVKRSRWLRPVHLLMLVMSVLIAGCSSITPLQQRFAATPQPLAIQPTQAATQTVPQPTTSTTASFPATVPTATLPAAPSAAKGRYENRELGIALAYPPAWEANPGEDETTLQWLSPYTRDVMMVLFYGAMPPQATLEQAAQQLRESIAAGDTGVQLVAERSLTLADGRAAWQSEYTAEDDNGRPLYVIITSAARSGRLVSVMAFGPPDNIANRRDVLDDIATSLSLQPPQVHGIPRDQALILVGGESNNPRVYDPATGGGDNLVFSGLVMLSPQLVVVPDLAESWSISDDGTVYTFYLRPQAQFHNGRPVTAQDVIYSWERAADPKTDSDAVLTYLGDIVGVREKYEGSAATIRGLKALNEHTLQVTIDAPKPYFLAKLTYQIAVVLDQMNVESGPEWYRTPNGTGAYRLIRWDAGKLKLYERNEAFYLTPPAIRHVVVQLYAGVGIRLYETGLIDMTGVGTYDAQRVRDPAEPLHTDLREGVNLCTSFITFDVTQPPFDDPKVRQAFVLAVDKQRYVDVVLNGNAVPARGLYPPGLPGYTANLEGLAFDPALARQRLSESRYAQNGLPKIVFTSRGYGSDVSLDIAALIEMWQTNLEVTIEVENLEPDEWRDQIHDGHHGQLFEYGWCADYPDPENFADALFHSNAQQNIGKYSNPTLDQVLEQARVEQNVTQRMQLYQQAERIIVEDAPALFLSHSLSYVLVKPHIQGYVHTPVHVPIERYLSMDASQLP